MVLLMTMVVFFLKILRDNMEVLICTFVCIPLAEKTFV